MAARQSAFCYATVTTITVMTVTKQWATKPQAEHDHLGPSDSLAKVVSKKGKF